MAFSGHKLYAPFGAGALIGPRRAFETGDPFLAGGGAVDLVDLDEVIWTEPPEREEAGSPNVVGAVAFGAAMDELERIGWDAIRAHEAGPVRPGCTRGCGPSTASRVLGPRATAGGPAEARRPRRGHVHRGGDAPRTGGGPPQRRVRHRRPARLLLRPPLPDPPARRRPRRGWTRRGPRCNAATAARSPAPCGPAAGSARRARTSTRCSTRCGALAGGRPAPVRYVQDGVTGDFWPEGDAGGWGAADRPAGAACARG